METSNYDIDLVMLLCYVVDWKKDKILKQVNYTSSKKSSAIEGYCLATYLMLNYMYEHNELFSDYIKGTSDALPYICGALDVEKSVQTNSLSENKMWQGYNALSLNTEVNLCIKFCLESLIKTRELKDTDLAKDVRKSLKSIFGTDAESINKDRIREYLNVICDCLNSDFYENYHPVLKLCQLYLEELYLVDGNIEDLKDSRLFSLDTPYLFQEFLRTVVRHVMLRLSKAEPYKKYLKGKWSMSRDDCHLETSNLSMDILVKFEKNSQFPHMIFDSKTNKSVIESLRDNRYQIQTYTTEYKAKNPNVIGVLQYFVDGDATKQDLSKNLTKLPSDIEGLDMYVLVYQVKPNSEPEEFEEYLYNQMIKLLGLK